MATHPRGGRSGGRRRTGWRWLAAGLAGAGALAAYSRAANAQPDCFEQLTQGAAPVIACSFPTRLSETEREDLKRITRGMLHDASCLVAINIERRLVSDALAATDHVFLAPPQPVTCELRTANRVFPISATFAPKVTIEGGRATTATPGMAGVTGVPSLLSWPVVQYVNRSGTIRDGMLRVINGYMSFTAPNRAR